MRALIDTCIVIDALQSRQPFSSAAQALFLGVANRRFDGFLTAKSITDIYYLTHRAAHSDAETRRILYPGALTVWERNWQHVEQLFHYGSMDDRIRVRILKYENC